MGERAETEVTSITVDRTSYVEVTFGDGKLCRFDLVELRQACPCATCRTAREQGRAAWPSPGRDTTELTLDDAELVGAWGLGVTWNDGHSTGIYPFDSLRRWCDAESPVAGFPTDSGLRG